MAVFLSRFCRDYVDEAGTPAAVVTCDCGSFTADLPETWMGSVEPGLIFWDLTNHEPWSAWGRLFSIVFYDTKETKNVPDAAPGQSGRLFTVQGKDGKQDVVVLYTGDNVEEGGLVHSDADQVYDPDNPRSYLKLLGQADGVLRTIRFPEGTRVLYTAPAYEEGAPVPETTHVHQWSGQWSKDETHHWHDCTAPGCPLRENGQKDGYAEHQGDWTVVSEATDRYAGKRYRTCTVCGSFQQEITPAKLPTEDVKTLDLGAGTVTLTGDDIAALLNSLRAIPDVVVDDMNLMGPLTGYYVDLDGDGIRDMGLTLAYKQTGPDEAPNQVEAVRCDALPGHSMGVFSGGVPKDRVDDFLETGLPIYGGVEICLSPETDASPAN